MQIGAELFLAGVLSDTAFPCQAMAPVADLCMIACNYRRIEMATQPGTPGPDIIQPQSPPETPAPIRPDETPLPDDPTIFPDQPDIANPGPPELPPIS